MAAEGSSLVARGLKLVASLVLGVLVVLALLLVLLGLFARPGSDGISRVHGHPILTVLSGSMRGVFNPGDMIIDNPITPSQSQRLAAGNIITFHVANTTSNNLITHRIVDVTNTNGQVTYQTKGDANNAPDPEPVTPAQIVGTYRNHIPYGGYLLQWTQQKTIFFVIIMVPVIYLVVMEIAKHWNEKDKGEDADAADASSANDAAMAAGSPESSQPVLAAAAARHRLDTSSDQPKDALLSVRSDPGGDRTDREGDRTPSKR